MNNVQLIDDTPPVVRPSGAVTTPVDLLRIAVESGADLDRLEKLMALQERWERSEAVKAYNAAFAQFKTEAVRIIRDKQINAGPLNGKKYASLASVIDAITPALTAHGLSASWRLTKDEPNWLEVTCSLRHVGGHTEAVAMGGPPDSGGAKNAIQARASTVSYLERYTLKAICGVSESDDDDDGNSAGPGHPSVGGPRPPVDRTMLMKVRRAIADKLANGNEMGALQEWEEAVGISEDFAGDVWAGLTSDNRESLRNLRKSAEQKGNA